MVVVRGERNVKEAIVTVELSITEARDLVDAILNKRIDAFVISQLHSAIKVGLRP